MVEPQDRILLTTIDKRTAITDFFSMNFLGSDICKNVCFLCRMHAGQPEKQTIKKVQAQVSNVALPDSEIPDQEGHGGFRRARVVNERFRDASTHQTWLCQRTRDGVIPEGDPTSLKKSKLESAYERSPIPGQLSTRAVGNIQTWYPGPGTWGNWRGGQ